MKVSVVAQNFEIEAKRVELLVPNPTSGAALIKWIVRLLVFIKFLLCS